MMEYWSAGVLGFYSSPSTPSLHHPRASFQRLNQSVADLVDVARPERQHDVARIEFTGNLRRNLIFVRHKCQFHVALSLHSLVQRFTCRAGNRILAGGINFREHQPIGAFESGEKLIEQISSTGETMRLEDDRQRALPAVANSADGGANFRGVMPVVVDHQDAPRFALDLEASVDASESGERLRGVREGNLQFVSYGHCSQSIGGAMTAGKMQTQLPQ